jgi:hypothetical protein
MDLEVLSVHDAEGVNEGRHGVSVRNELAYMAVAIKAVVTHVE